jgi:hypothetical protein
MSRECIICGRPLKTGRKYCWEHKNTKSEHSIESSLIDKHSKNFLRERGELGKPFGIFLFLWMFLMYIVAGIFNQIFLASIMLILWIIGWFFLIKWLIKKNKQEPEELEDYLKNKIREERDHKEWKRNLISSA